VRQEDQEFEASLGNVQYLASKGEKKKKTLSMNKNSKSVILLKLTIFAGKYEHFA
jgi:hypothetical protein